MSTWDEVLANGIPVDGTGPIPVRKEINTLSDAELFLFVEGMRRFQQVDQDETLSYFRIAGIHGRPYDGWLKWDNDIPLADDNKGYCTHSSIIFLTWHRPYLALFESTLYKHVQEVVADFENPNEVASPDQKSWKQLGLDFRLPYWDWARWESPDHFPPVVQLEESRVLPPPKFKSSVKTLKTDYNPLFSCPFKDDTDGEINFAKDLHGKPLNRTVRYPGKAAEEGLSLLEARMNELFNKATGGSGIAPLVPKNLSERVGYILQSYKRFNPLSNNKAPGSTDDGGVTAGAGVYGSLEDIHNSVHNLVGGEEGHMSDIAVSAFEPVFWLHHANIDRLCAIWEAIHQSDEAGQEETWVTKAEAPGTRSIPDGFQDGTTPLYPFRHSTKDDKNFPKGFFTSNTVKRTEDFGYAYPEISGKTYPLSTSARQALGRDMEALYRTPSTSLMLSAAKVQTAGQEMLPQAALIQRFAKGDIPATSIEKAQVSAELPDQQQLLQASLEPSKPVLRDILHDNKYLEWLIDVRGEKHALRGAYSVHFFLGDVQEENPYLWPASPYYLGSFAPMGQDSATGCGKCRQEQRNELQVTGQIPLTIALMERYLAQLIPDMNVPTVVDFLTKNLHWRVSLDGQVLADRSQVAGLRVFVVTNEVTLSTDGSPPVYAPDVVIHPEITTNVRGTGRGEGTGLTQDQA